MLGSKSKVRFEKLSVSGMYLLTIDNSGYATANQTIVVKKGKKCLAVWSNGWRELCPPSTKPHALVKFLIHMGQL